MHNTFQPNAEQATSVSGGSPPALRTVQQRLITSGKIEYFNSPDHDTTLTNVAAKKGVCLADFLRCMMDRKTLKESAEECQISVSTAFAWRHKILDALQELAGGVDNIPIKVGEQVRRINAA